MVPITPQLARQVGIARDEELPSLAWPGFYRLFYLDVECNALCPACANEDRESVRHADVNWEDDTLYCDQCSAQIIPAYGDD